MVWFGFWFLYRESWWRSRLMMIERLREKSDSEHDDGTLLRLFDIVLPTSSSLTLCNLHSKIQAKHPSLYHEYHCPRIPCTGLSGKGTQTFSFLCFSLLSSLSCHCLTRVASSFNTMLKLVQGVCIMYVLPRAR